MRACLSRRRRPHRAAEYAPTATPKQSNPAPICFVYLTRLLSHAKLSTQSKREMLRRLDFISFNSTYSTGSSVTGGLRRVPRQARSDCGPKFVVRAVRNLIALPERRPSPSQARRGRMAVLRPATRTSATSFWMARYSAASPRRRSSSRAGASTTTPSARTRPSAILVPSSKMAAKPIMRWSEDGPLNASRLPGQTKRRSRPNPCKLVESPSIAKFDRDWHAVICSGSSRHP